MRSLSTAQPNCSAAGPTSRVRPARLEARAIEIRNPPISVPFRSLDLMLDRDMCPADRFRSSVRLRSLLTSGSSSGAEAGSTGRRSRNSAPPSSDRRDLKSVFDETLGAITQRIAAAVDRPRDCATFGGLSRLSHRRDRGRESAVRFANAVRRTAGQSPHRRATTALQRGSERAHSSSILILTTTTSPCSRGRAPSSSSRVPMTATSSTFSSSRTRSCSSFACTICSSTRRFRRYTTGRAARARRRPRLAARFRAVLSDLQARVADITETDRARREFAQGHERRVPGAHLRRRARALSRTRVASAASSAS